MTRLINSYVNTITVMVTRNSRLDCERVEVSAQFSGLLPLMIVPFPLVFLLTT